MSSDADRVLLVPDTHCDDCDWKAIGLAAQIAADFKPTRIIYLGDTLDCGWASERFRQDQTSIAGQLERELAAWERVQSYFDAPRIDLLPGNHERRIRDFIWRNPALAGFRPLDTAELFRLKPNTKVANNGCIWLAQGKFLVTHGKVVRRWSCQSAKAELEAWGVSGASGHTHRLGTYYQRDALGLRSWTECGHLAKNPPRYAAPNEPGAANWQQGVVTIDVVNNHFHVETVPFTLKYRAFWRGKEYRG